MSEKYIFMAEDNKDDIALMIRALKKCNVYNRLVIVGDGKEAISYLVSPDLIEKPAIVILDLKLPLIDGLEVLRQIRAEQSTREIPVVILSSSIDENDRKRSIRLGADDFYCKPINFDEFMNLVCQISTRWL